MDIEQLLKENDELKAYIERLRGALQKVVSDSGVGIVPRSHLDHISELLYLSPQASLNHILSQVEEETIERCASYIEDLVTLHDYNAGDAKSAVMFIQRKYKEQFNEG